MVVHRHLDRTAHRCRLHSAQERPVLDRSGGCHIVGTSLGYSVSAPSEPSSEQRVAEEHKGEASLGLVSALGIHHRVGRRKFRIGLSGLLDRRTLDGSHRDSSLCRDPWVGGSRWSQEAQRWQGYA